MRITRRTLVRAAIVGLTAYAVSMVAVAPASAALAPETNVVNVTKQLPPPSPSTYLVDYQGGAVDPTHPLNGTVHLGAVVPSFSEVCLDGSLQNLDTNGTVWYSVGGSNKFGFVPDAAKKTLRTSCTTDPVVTSAVAHGGDVSVVVSLDSGKIVVKWLRMILR